MFHLGCVSLTFSHCQLFHSEQSMRASLAAVSDHLWQISARWLNCQCKWAGLQPHGRNTETWPGDSGLCFQKQMWNGKSSKLLREEQMACWKNCMWNLNDREQQQQPLLSHSDIFNFYPRVSSHLLRANNFHVLLLQCSYLHGVAYPSWVCIPALSSALGEPCPCCHLSSERDRASAWAVRRMRCWAVQALAERFGHGLCFPGSFPG